MAQTKFAGERPYADPEVAARKLVELAAGIEPVQDGRIYIEKTNAPFMYTLKATGPEFGAGIKHAVERSWLELHESGTYVRLMKTDTANWEPGALFARRLPPHYLQSPCTATSKRCSSAQPA